MQPELLRFAIAHRRPPARRAKSVGSSYPKTGSIVCLLVNDGKVDFQGSRVTSDGGLILVRGLDERLGFGELIAQHLSDSRRRKNTQLPLADLFRQSVYSRIAGYEDVNDAERLSQDPTFRLIGSEKTWDRGAALTSPLQKFETEMLAEEENFGSLARINRELIG
jgi:hypothetical protein